jgi:sulfide:quinone oxidoreductase
MFEFLFGMDTQLRREGPARPLRTGVLQPGHRARQPAGPPGRAPPAGRNGAPGHPYPPGAQDATLRAQGGHRRRRVCGRPDPLHARHDGQRLVRQRPTCRARPAAWCRPTPTAACPVPEHVSTWWATRAASPGRLDAQTSPHGRSSSRGSGREPAGRLAGPQGQARFKVELVCIVDALDQGTLVWRTPTRQRLLPPLRAMHWAKRAFEWNYLRPYR